ncbi:MAG: alginate lyase family protein [Sulfuricurvum sp.]|uniref:alginate lyase family protein n=1 Tax=Sulfuricurvum sp. TaxID=2025608 RepID=UPI0026152822|nr:alginate lyase family protein [Sulfuricurvum sp.]MDD2367670.1 alginate lyase family protein [Sulfuricurvum sp.]MDD5118595.1 alginate lyase family protein [Sulfuricurvum sp.]
MNFTFLNKSHTFSLRIDWNFSEYGKLWTYNLCYFDFLHQTSISQEEGITLIHNFIDQAALHKDALEPFPISLRGINWIKFLSLHHISDPIIDDSLFSQYHILLDNLEYHLLGNHLLENGFSLLFGAYYYQNESFYSAAKTILLSELEEQILSDGAHFELSPMYHQIMLFRVLDCINLVKNNPWKTHELLLPLEKKASLMLGWLTTITYKDGSIPLLNDSAKGIAPTSANLFEYARLLEISPLIQPLTKSGYRKIVTENYECVLDVGNIGPDYIPGHAHSDTFNFELHIMGKPFIVDTGISTYESNQLRQIERSTASHNTVMIDNKEQSDVWGGFRVADRAKIIHLSESQSTIEATHDGYLKIGALHTRRFSFDSKHIKIEDTVQSKNSYPSVAYLHCHPDTIVNINDNTILINDVTVTCQNHSSLALNTYNYAPEFNTLIPATVIECTFQKTLSMEITL